MRFLSIIIALFFLLSCNTSKLNLSNTFFKTTKSHLGYGESELHFYNDSMYTSVTEYGCLKVSNGKYKLQKNILTLTPLNDFDYTKYKNQIYICGLDSMIKQIVLKKKNTFYVDGQYYYKQSSSTLNSKYFIINEAIGSRGRLVLK
jgi:hypothetical protein